MKCTSILLDYIIGWTSKTGSFSPPSLALPTPLKWLQFVQLTRDMFLYICRVLWFWVQENDSESKGIGMHGSCR